MSGILEQLRPEVREYDYRGYRLGYDLANLQRSSDASVHEATVFYAARVLEAVSAAAVDAVGLTGKENVFANLSRLEELSLLPRTTQYWAHALRRAGNGVRHARSEVASEQEETVVAFLAYWLRWYFCRFDCGEQLPALTIDPDARPFVRDEGLADLLDGLESGRLDPTVAAAAVIDGPYPKVRHAPAVLAVLAERMLDANALDETSAFLDFASALHGDDLRLLQLRGLCRSRAGRLDEAIEILEPFYKRFRNDDEMVGIMAGVYKRKWRARPDDGAWLRRSHNAYKAGFKQDRENTYLGINVASTALMLGRDEQSHNVAAEVREVLLGRAEVLARLQGRPDATLGLWDQLTLAEAELLGGDAQAAAERFASAARAHSDTAGSLGVAREQLQEIARRLGKPPGLFD